jgi:L-lysine 2,3-aminomutase
MGRSYLLEALVTKLEAGKVAKAPVAEIRDDGTVRIGTATPVFPPVRVAPAHIADREQVRIGTATPIFPPSRTQ